MNRSCLDPMDPDCPLSAPNKDKGEVKSHTQHVTLVIMYTK